jgi:HJR/Mrr/RecB family endonuclease
MTSLARRIIEWEDEGKQLSELEDEMSGELDNVPKRRIRTVLAQEKTRADTLRKIGAKKERSARYIDIHDIDNLTGLQFEKILARILSKVEGDAEVTQGSGDQGVDILWRKDEGTVVVQAKAYKPGNKATNSSVQQVNTGAKNHQEKYDVIEEAVITTSDFTESAREAAEFSDVALYNRKDVRSWLNEQKIGLDEFGEVIEE